jgi:hypothetical protein
VRQRTVSGAAWLRIEKDDDDDNAENDHYDSWRSKKVEFSFVGFFGHVIEAPFNLLVQTLSPPGEAGGFFFCPRRVWRVAGSAFQADV